MRTDPFMERCVSQLSGIHLAAPCEYLFRDISASGIFLISLILTTTLSLQSSLAQDTGKQMKKILRNEWNAGVQSVHGLNGAVRPNVAKHARYGVVSHTGKEFQVDIDAFKDSETTNFWIGPKQEFYVVTPNEVIGGTILLGGAIQWGENCAKGETSRELDQAIAHFEANVPGDKLVELPKNTPFADKLKEGFCNPRPFDAHAAATPLLGLQLELPLLKLEIRSADGTSVARIWVDVEKRTVVKAFQDDEQTFPKKKLR